MTPTITFVCGHSTTFDRDVKDAPICQQCGERRVKKVSGATPRFTGSCSGPLVKQVQP